MKTSQEGIDIIKFFESLSLKAYKCPAGLWTIGYGHTGDVHEGDEITEHRAEKLLKEDIEWAENVVNSVGVDLRQNQFDALVSFVFNVGVGNFKTSTLLRKLRVNPDDPTIPDEFRRWNRSGGKVLPGLITRRNKEAELYERT